MVDMLQYDKSEVRVEGSVDVSEQEVRDLDIQIETESILNDSFFILSMLETKFQFHHVVDRIVKQKPERGKCLI